jgi:hypothetical protein
MDIKEAGKKVTPLRGGGGRELLANTTGVPLEKGAMAKELTQCLL